ncbi:hypothetical protein PINS_up001523 [Pythium insidiosum]|nr:hypothetical protein PINS_up001523 [Pythium insidiosum]
MRTSPLFHGVREAVRRSTGGFVSPSIEAQVIPGMGVGVVAREPIPRDTLVFQAGRDVWLPFSAEHAMHEAQCKAPAFVTQLDALFNSSALFRDRSSFLPNAIVLGTHLAMAQTESTSSSAAELTEVYLQSLPTFVDLPFFWDDKQFQALDACHEVRASIQQSAELYFQIYQHLFGSANNMVPPERFFWAIAVLMSRATSGKAQPFTLIPFFDWFNHTHMGDECGHEYDPQRGFVVFTTRDYEAGEQLCISYGQHSNTRLLRNYGFTIPSNPNDTVALTLPRELQQFDAADQMRKEKMETLQSLGAPTALKALTLHSSGALSPSSKLWLQLRIATSEELLALMEESSASESGGLQIPASLEDRVQRIVVQLCQGRLSNHQATVEVARFTTCCI